MHHLAATLNRQHTVRELVALRHFASHGQATSDPPLTGIDYDLLGYFPKLLAAGLEQWWKDLQDDDKPCNQLAKANVLPLRYWPVQKSWIMFEQDASGRYPSITEIFGEFDWTLRP